jgi:carboxypeptidase Taq
MRRIADLRFANSVLQWDQETYLPANGARFRGQQISTLSELSHHYFSEEALGALLNELCQRGDLGLQERRNVERTLEDYRKNKKYSTAFVRKFSEQINKCYHSWVRARKANDFHVFAPDLNELIVLKRQEAELLGFEGHPYNALLDEFEKGCTVALLDKTFGELLPMLKKLLDQIATLPETDNSFLHQHFDKQKQWEWGLFLLKELQFDFESGRQDLSEHPFSISFNPRDVRITTRIDESDFGNMTWSCIHEAGHALYEQGLTEEQYGLPLGEACSYSIHESQSRLWENNVGRSLPFWQYYYPILQKTFPEAFAHITLENFYKGINKVRPSLIRTESDELSYHFHVFIRYELEKELISGTLKTGNIPAFWNEQYLKLLGVQVPDDRRGCLQDVHWSHGSFGYFPTYSLGSFYAAQFFLKATEEVPDLQDSIKNGHTEPVLQWLRKYIHASGRYYTSEELCANVTGSGINIKYFYNYILRKFETIYSL